MSLHKVLAIRKLRCICELALCFVVLFGLVNTAVAVTFVVNSTGDGPDATPGNGVCSTGGTNSQGAAECTLRAAIEETIAAGGPDTINFNMPITEPGYSASPLSYTTQPTSPYPALANGLNIDGTSQPDFPGTPIVVIDGVSAGAGTNGLLVNGGGSARTIRGLVIQNFNFNGILLQTNNNTVAGNYIGIAADGTTVAPNNAADLNSQGGIRIESVGNTIGGSSAADRNVISGNLFAGIEIFGLTATGNQVYGNYIGLDAGGTQGRGNTQEGIDLEFGAGNFIGGPLAGQRNIISGDYVSIGRR